MRICRDTLAKSGYLTSGGTVHVLEGIMLTGKGWVRNQHHIAEGMGNGAKDRQFEALFKSVEPQLYELGMPGKMNQSEEQLQPERDLADISNKPDGT